MYTNINITRYSRIANRRQSCIRGFDSFYKLKSEFPQHFQSSIQESLLFKRLLLAV